LGQPPAVAGAYAATVRAQVAILTTLNTEIATLEGQVEAHFGQHPDAEIYLSQPGLGVVLGARVLAEFGDDKTRYADARARKNYAGTSPITRQSGRKKTVLARYVHNDRLIDALSRQAFAALRASPSARAYYDQLHARGVATTPRSVNSATAWSASCTAASPLPPPMTKPPHGHTTNKIYKPLLDAMNGRSLRSP
jgi:transposase